MSNERYELNKNLAQMLKGGVIMDVTTPEQARIAQEAGACAVMALERIPADIRAAGGVARMSDPAMIKGIQNAVTIPVMAKCRIGHFAEAQILEAIEIDYIDESEVLSPADDKYHIDKTKFNVPFVCGAKDLGEALRRISEGASMIRTKGEPGTGDVVQAVRHMRMMQQEIRRLTSMSTDELYQAAKDLQVDYELVKYVAENGKLPVVNFAAGGVANERFVNSAVRIFTLYSPFELLSVISQIETGGERVRSERWGNRTLDIDVIFYDDCVISANDLCVPHIDMQNRAFVLEPLCELCPNKLHPILKKRVCELKSDLDNRR